MPNGSSAARRLGQPLEPLVLQSALLVQIGPDEQARVRLRRMGIDTHMRLRRMDEVVALAQAIADGTLDAATAREQLRRMSKRPPMYPPWAIGMCYGLYGAASAARAGGGPLEMVAAALTGLLACLIHFGAVYSMQIDLQQSFIAGTAGTLCVSLVALQVVTGLVSGSVLFRPRGERDLRTAQLL